MSSANLVKSETELLHHRKECNQKILEELKLVLDNEIGKLNTANNRHSVWQDTEVKTADKELPNSDYKGNKTIKEEKLKTNKLRPVEKKKKNYSYSVDKMSLERVNQEIEQCENLHYQELKDALYRKNMLIKEFKE